MPVDVQRWSAPLLPLHPLCRKTLRDSGYKSSTRTSCHLSPLGCVSWRGSVILELSLVILDILGIITG